MESVALSEENSKKERLIRITRTTSKIVFAVPLVPSLLCWPQVIMVSRAYMPSKPISAILLLIGVFGYAMAYTLALVVSDKMYENMRYKDSILMGFLPMAFLLFSAIGFFSIMQ